MKELIKPLLVLADAIRRAGDPFYGKLPTEMLGRQRDFFTYTAEYLTLAASATATVDLSIQADSDFLILGGVRAAFSSDDLTLITDANTYEAFAPFLVNITDTGSGRSFMDRAVHVDNLFGTAQRPALWMFPKLIRASSVISTRLQNLTATARNVRLSYVGFKIFDYPTTKR